MKYRIEIGDAEVVRRDDELMRDCWETVASGETLLGLVHDLLRAANDGEFSLELSYLRMAETKRQALG